MDRATGRPRGFGFVTMASAEDAQKAIDALNGKTVGGRALTVNVARPREDRPAGGGGGGRGYGGGGGGGRSGGGGGGGGRNQALITGSLDLNRIEVRLPGPRGFLGSKRKKRS